MTTTIRQRNSVGEVWVFLHKVRKASWKKSQRACQAILTRCENRCESLRAQCSCPIPSWQSLYIPLSSGDLRSDPLRGQRPAHSTVDDLFPPFRLRVFRGYRLSHGRCQMFFAEGRLAGPGSDAKKWWECPSPSRHPLWKSNCPAAALYGYNRRPLSVGRPRARFVSRRSHATENCARPLSA